MKRFAPLTLIATSALVLAGCSGDTETAAEPEPVETTADAPEPDTRPAGVPVIEDQLNVDEWAERIQDESITELNEDGIPVHAADNEYDVLLADGVIEPGYSMIAPIEDARYTCYLLSAIIGNTGTVDETAAEAVLETAHTAQTGRTLDPDYPDVQEYKDDEKPNAHIRAALINLCPDSLEYIDDSLVDQYPYSDAIAELNS